MDGGCKSSLAKLRSLEFCLHHVSNSSLYITEIEQKKKKIPTGNGVITCDSLVKSNPKEFLLSPNDLILFIFASQSSLESDQVKLRTLFTFLTKS